MDLSPFSLEGKRALVTGGGRGIGAACAQALAQAGAEVVVVSRTAAQLQEVVHAIAARDGKAHAMPADLGHAAGVDALSGGRLEVGFARAFPPHEFRALGRSLDESRARFSR